MTKFNQILLAFVIFAVSFNSIALAITLNPVLMGQMFDGTIPADGSVVTVYPQSNSSDNLTDTVGMNGSMNISSYWSVNLNNLNTPIQNGDIIVVKISNGTNKTTRFYTVNLNDGVVNLSLNYNPSFQDYDNDAHFANTDCNDNNAGINPSASDTCGDGIDQDCSGSDASCPESSSPSGGGGGVGGGGGGGGGGVALNWQCTEWSECTLQGTQTRKCTLGSGPGFSTKPAESQSCNYTAAQGAQSSEGTSSSIQLEASGQTKTEEEPAAAESTTPPASTGLAAITGEAVADFVQSKSAIGILALLVLAILGYYVYRKYYKK